MKAWLLGFVRITHLIIHTTPLINRIHANTHTHTQDKLDVEGSLFVVKRASAPLHQFVVMNRRNADNFVEDISTASFQIQDSDPYLMYRNQSNEIIGIWFYNSAEREQVAKMIRRFWSRRFASRRFFVRKFLSNN